MPNLSVLQRLVTSAFSWAIRLFALPLFAPRPDARLPFHDRPLLLTCSHQRETVLLAALPRRAEAILRKLPSSFASHAGRALWPACYFAIRLEHHRELRIRMR
jgi:hypothetical protein